VHGGAGGRLDLRELGRARLVALDQLVGLGAGEAPLLPELGKPVPLIAVRGGEGVEIHLVQ
jgi:hypothetical protein